MAKEWVVDAGCGPYVGETISLEGWTYVCSERAICDDVDGNVVAICRLDLVLPACASPCPGAVDYQGAGEEPVPAERCHYWHFDGCTHPAKR